MNDHSHHPGRRHHILIAGTGRAGTSALVRYLAAIGLETHLSKHGEAAGWSDSAQAGLEDLAISAISPNLPYVIKSPWSYQFIEEILSDPQIHLDAVIIPVRDLTEATASRTILELQSVHREAGWMAQMSTTWEHWALTPGGVIFSLNPIDQARLLAVGFHRLLERLVEADVPTVLLAFPRLTSDADYLFTKLSPVIPIDVSIERAREAHAATFSADMVRVDGELSGESRPSPDFGKSKGPDLGALDNAALRRSLIELRKQLAEAEADRALTEGDLISLRDQLERQRSQFAESETNRAASERECAALREQFERQVADTEREGDEKAQLHRQVLALRSSRSWRMTSPFRALSRALTVTFRSN